MLRRPPPDFSGSSSTAPTRSRTPGSVLHAVQPAATASSGSATSASQNQVRLLRQAISSTVAPAPPAIPSQPLRDCVQYITGADIPRK